MTKTLDERVRSGLNYTINPAISQYAELLAKEAGAIGVIFYGSNLRTGSLEGVLDFYLLLPGEPEGGIWPRVSYREWEYAGQGEPVTLRAKIATVTLATFAKAACGELIDTTIWARFVQPCAIIWTADDPAQSALLNALKSAAKTAARLAAALGPDEGSEWQFWKALFGATYSAELRVEKAGREDTILETHKAHFVGLFPAALEAQAIACPLGASGDSYAPQISAADKAATLRWWNKRRRLGKPLNIVRLLKATTTFEGAARYGAWKVERHTGQKIPLTQWQEDHPILAAPSFIWKVWRAKRRTLNRG